MRAAGITGQGGGEGQGGGRGGGEDVEMEIDGMDLVNGWRDDLSTPALGLQCAPVRDRDEKNRARKRIVKMKDKKSQNGWANLKKLVNKGSQMVKAVIPMVDDDTMEGQW
jgi:hypothetical protein